MDEIKKLKEVKSDLKGHFDAVKHKLNLSKYAELSDVFYAVYLTGFSTGALVGTLDQAEASVDEALEVITKHLAEKKLVEIH